MPGKGSYGPGGKWIHDRAHEIMKSTKDEYGSERGKEVAYAIATQQAHKLGNTKKDYGTKKSEEKAKEKYDKPKEEYKKTAADYRMAAMILNRWRGHK